MRGENKPVVAVVGDGALTGGMCWEALNNIAGADRPVVVVVNDNGRSYSPTTGGLAEHLNRLRLQPGYERMLGQVKGALGRTPVVGPPLYDALHGMKRGIKDLLAPQGMFEDLGIKYVGPVDGHDFEALEDALRLARGFQGPVLVHCVTRKGYGYAPAENDVADQMHQSRGFDPITGRARASSGRTWTSVFGRQLVALGEQRDDIVAITAAMCEPTGLGEFSRRFPERAYDVGIAEQHALTSAAGLASGGMHPIVAVYATFLNRAFDQLLMDVALHRLPVTVVLDRAGITGDDGPSPQRHVGSGDSRRRARICASPPRATKPRCATNSPRRPPTPTARRSCASPRRRWGPTCPRCAEWAASTSWPSPMPRRGRRARDRDRRHRRRRPRRRVGRAQRRIHRPGRRSALGEPGRPRNWSTWPAPVAWSSPSRTASSPAASGRGSPRRCGQPMSTSPVARSAFRLSSSHTATSRTSAPRPVSPSPTSVAASWSGRRSFNPIANRRRTLRPLVVPSSGDGE